MALEIAKQSVKGSLILFVSNMSATLFNVIALVLIARLLGPSGYGTYTLALLIPGVLQLFIGFGALPAVIRYAAYYTSIGREDEAKRFTLNVILFLVLTGGILTIFCYMVAGSLSSLILQRPSIGPYVQLASLSILGTTVMQTATMSAIGWNRMTLSGMATITQSIAKVAFTPFLILLGFGITGALAGHLASYFLAGCLGVSILYLRKLRGFGHVSDFIKDTKTMNAYGLPVYAGSLLTGLAGYFVLVILASITRGGGNSVYGYYQAAVNFTTPITLFSTAMISSLFPAFASIDGIRADVNQAFRHAYKFVAFLLTPIVLFLIASAEPLINIVYGNAYIPSVPYLKLLAFAYLPIAFGFTVHPAFFNGFGRTRLTLLLNLTSSASLFLAAPLLTITLGMGVEGLIIAIFISLFVAWAVGTFLAFEFFHAVLDLKSTGIILAVSVVSFLATSIVPTGDSALITLIINLAIFSGVYATLAPIAGAVTSKDLELLELTLSEPEALRKIVSPLLRYERLLINIRRQVDRTSENKQPLSS